MTKPGRTRGKPATGPVAAFLGTVLLLAATGAAAPPRPTLSLDGEKAFEMAKVAEDGVAADSEHGENLLKQIQALKAPDRDAEAVKALKALQDEAVTSHGALDRYRKQALAGASEAFQLLADAARPVTSTPPDPIRQSVFEQRALLAAHEAAVMAARARAEAERLRAIHADARALLAAGRAAGPAGSSGAPSAGPPEASGRDVVVPNVVGARLDRAAGDLQAVGLRLGATTGPRDGYVVKQTPPAGTRVPRQAAVNLTLSATAAGVK